MRQSDRFVHLGFYYKQFGDMMQKHRFVLSIVTVTLFFLSLQSCSFKIIKGDNEYGKLEKLSEWMSGSFTSEEQSKLDSNYYNIHLEMVRIWPERKDGIWLYVEQAANWALDKPYRQRVYKLTDEGCGDVYKSAVFTFKDPLRFAGAFIDKDLLGNLTVDSLSEKLGCHIILKYSDCEFNGSTEDITCASELRGSSFATSEVSISKYEIRSWDRGFDEEGKQVWGARTGPYIFKKRTGKDN